MSEQQQEEQTLDSLRQQFVEYAVQSTFAAHGGDMQNFNEFWDLVGKSIELDSNHKVIIHGKVANDFLTAFKASKELREKFFQPDFQTQQTQQTQQPQTATAKAAATPDVLYVSQAQLNDRRFMRQVPEITAAIQAGRVKVDDAKAVQDVAELKTFLTPKAEASPTAKPAPKRTTEISKDDLLNRTITRRLEQEWASEGGYLAAISKGLIKVV
ncbi:MAG: hypothetical protein J0L70_23705 [Leptolyngbya sp. UWPOB_LEPTO1]|uniref:hypothetical protein n=1 Tax=Leptolyngbya sp. UWPOB_LEPTO1 TaxID=2815653 RepID=UPI001AC967FD|nr:hypothetical protein [Leptolyngbya sp. UWPOB_LEPTO1]MBN8563549.1 hypothetical protein [Leptolyngbya sp. UWPOB_LEPTO1]